ncbi:uncharacterized protein TRIVIDRAFT_62054 [Trichoderma virens Gv29-8]|uniref:Uncharacterized protein n=1 Tax=Hypocrea virens (strain Gv29-8 / FGSC 10586) TaxID=413071 RepID=G9MIP8_HYPVG|nr:uncharacterized protein TRIVIDRAFT_62054 [Trichoderma virens Gv29-8]EHK25365.1 hypothetical protein TRIVIDRAFT_62054 [Trichoderma virens Gv29-8]UKZ48813.1 hypothetical protein TrVGV298_003046 [Trichoderma virens]
MKNTKTEAQCIASVQTRYPVHSTVQSDTAKHRRLTAAPAPAHSAQTGVRSHDASILASAVPQQKRERRIMRYVPRHRCAGGPRFWYLRIAQREASGTSALFAYNDGTAMPVGRHAKIRESM